MARPEGHRGDASSGENETSPQRLIEFLQGEFYFPAIDLYIERKFEQAGLLDVLEQAEILPVTPDPNPFDPAHDERSYDQWWTDHPDELEVYEQKDEERRTILRYLHIGALIGHLSGGRLYPGRLPTI